MLQLADLQNNNLQNNQLQTTTTAGASKTLAGTKRRSSSSCSGHCNGEHAWLCTSAPQTRVLTGDCRINPEQIDADCVATETLLQNSHRRLRSVGTSAHPKWEYMRGDFKAILGTVECPCTTSNVRVQTRARARAQVAVLRCACMCATYRTCGCVMYAASVRA